MKTVIMLVLSFVLWERTVVFNRLSSDIWRPVGSFGAFEECKRMAVRRAAKDAGDGGPTTNLETWTVNRDVHTSDLGAQMSVTWSKKTKEPVVNNPKGFMPLEQAEGFSADYECWHSDVNRNRLGR